VAPEERAAPLANTVLIVDDEADVRALVRDVLTEQGYHVVEAASGVEALRICLDPDRAVDILITDIFMPGMDGIELAERLGALGRRLRVLFMSAHSDTGDVTKGGRSLRQIGGSLLAKPFTIAALIDKVRETLSDPSRPDRRRDAAG
jgi:CheY-like chemotaxis protein